MEAPRQNDLPVPATDRGRSTRARVLASAEVVFGELGFEQASVTAITQGANIAQGSFYTYFPSKHAVFVEVIRQAHFELRSRVAASANAAVGGTSRVAAERAGMETAFQFFCDRRAIFSMVREAQVVAPELYEWWVRSFVDAYVENFRRFTPTAPDDLDVEAVACVVQGTFDMLALWYVHWRGAVPPTRVVDQTLALLARGLDGLLHD
jgi:AcrR family transcriptional regulator